jgi:hypothetical protein
MHGLYVHLVHTGTTNKPLFLSDIYPTTDGHTAFRRAGPVYLPVNGTIDLAYTGEVAASFESGTIRGFFDLGYLTAEVLFGDGVGPPISYIKTWSSLVPDTNTATELFINGLANTRLVLEDDTAYHYKVRVVAIDTGAAGQVAWWDVTGGLYRGAGAATTVQVGANVAITQNLGGNSAGWLLNISADAVNGSLLIEGTVPASVGDVRYVATGYLTPVAA